RHFASGDRVATWAGGSAEVLRLHLGAALASIVLVTLNPANRAAELEYLLQQGATRGLFLDRSFRGSDNVAVIDALRGRLPDLQTVVYLDGWTEFVDGSAMQALPVVAADSPAMILFTSGTTGKPKGAVLLHRGLVNNARLSAARLQLPAGAVWLNVLPLFH